MPGGCLVGPTVYGSLIEGGSDEDETGDAAGTSGAAEATSGSTESGFDTGWTSEDSDTESGDGDGDATGDGDGDEGEDEGDEPLPDFSMHDLPPCCGDTEVLFTEVAAESGINHAHGVGFAAPGNCLIDTTNPPFPGLFCSIEWTAGGAAAADVDGDGWVDLYITRIDEAGILYRNLGDGTFANVTNSANLGGLDQAAGAAFADVDNDGDLDLYVTTIGRLRHHLMINQGGWFIDEAVARGASLESGNPQTGTTPAFGDYDNDGYLDLYVGSWHTNAIGDFPSHARLLHNRGAEAPGEFEDVTDLVGVNVDDVHLESETPTIGAFVLSSGWADLDDDG